MYIFKLLINGELVSSTSDQLIEVRSPFNNEIIGTVPRGTPEDVSKVLKSSKVAQMEWAKLTAVKRAGYIIELADIIFKNRDLLANMLTEEVGKPIKEALEEVDGACRFLKYAAESATRIEGNITTSEIENEQIWIQRVPYGVTVGIVAWNYPLALTTRKIGNALVCGNTMVVKAPSETPLTIMKFAELVSESSLPQGVLNFITGSGSVVGNALVDNDITKLVTLTGSTAAGIEVFKAAAKNTIPIRLELGGKAPFIVMDDADIDKAVEAAVISRFLNGGQICTCNERMYIHKAIYDEFKAKLIERTKKIKVGNPNNEDTDMGPKINKAEVKKLDRMINLALEQGGKVILDMTPEIKPNENGNWYFPIIIEVEDNYNEIMQNELFGPVLPIMKVEDFDQAIQFANQSKYGLSAYLFTNNAKNIMRSVNELDFGEVYVNRENGELINAFHNGYKLSGIGGEDGRFGLEGYMQKKTIYMNYNY